MRFGVCYYPEHWPTSRWATDAAMMRAAGIEIVRIAEFAWSRMEPQPGVYDWAWLDAAIDTLAAAGLDVVLGTPTATPPVWLVRAHPEVLLVDPDGRPRDHGARRHACPTNARYRDHARQIVAAMAQRYAAHPAVIGWQIDNEFGGGHSARCYCAACDTGFRDWLATRYGEIATLNSAWGNVFWSQEYGAFDEVTVPHDGIIYKNPSHALDYYRYATQAYVDFQQVQIDAIRAATAAADRPEVWITHNFMGLYRDLDQFLLAAPLDLATWDSYPTGNPDRWRKMLYPTGTRVLDPGLAYDAGDPYITGLGHAVTYGLKQQPFWVMEQQAGYINWGDVNPGIRPGTPRLWVWHAVSEGAEAIVFFRWRATVLAQEQYHSGLLRHDATPDVGLGELAPLMAEKELLDAIAATPAAAPVALLFSFDDLWAIEIQPHRRGYDYMQPLFTWYRALRRAGIDVHVVPDGADLTPYRLVIAPTLHLADDALAAQLQAYVAAGGTLLCGVRSGFKGRSSLVRDEPLPGALRALIGARVTSWQSLPDAVQWSVGAAAGLPVLAAGTWVETLVAERATPLLHYSDGPAAGAAALTVHTLGDGQALYLAFLPAPDQADTLVRYLADQLNLPIVDALPPGVVVRRRGDYQVALNFTDQAQSLTLAGRHVTLAARDAQVWQL